MRGPLPSRFVSASTTIAAAALAIAVCWLAPPRPVLTAFHPIDHAAFRLGTAARPFAWATAIADFNADGLPDVATADRIGDRSDRAGYRYEIQVVVSGAAPQSVAFESPQAALTVSVRDVDHDNRLDIVVSDVVSRRVTNVWLNDGRGRFRPSTPLPFNESVGTISTFDDGEAAASLLISAGVNAGPLAIALDAISRVPDSPDERLCDFVGGSRSERALSRQPSRAPPAVRA